MEEESFSEEIILGEDEFYSETAMEELVENNEIEDFEEGFMQGYLHA
jgi:hypothetical protein